MCNQFEICIKYAGLISERTNLNYFLDLINSHFLKDGSSEDTLEAAKRFRQIILSFQAEKDISIKKIIKIY